MVGWVEWELYRDGDPPYLSLKTGPLEKVGSRKYSFFFILSSISLWLLTFLVTQLVSIYELPTLCCNWKDWGF